MSKSNLEIGHGRFRKSCSIKSSSSFQVAEVKVLKNALVLPSVLRLLCCTIMPYDYVIKPILFDFNYPHNQIVRVIQGD